MAKRTLLTLATCLALAAFAVACDDDGEPEPSPTTEPTSVATLPATPRPSPSPAPTVDPEATPGAAATIELSAEPQALTCDGATPSVITARVLDDLGQPVADGTMVNFSVVALGSVDPVNAATTGGIAMTEMTALAEQAGVVITVTSGEAAGSIRVDCQ